MFKGRVVLAAIAAFILLTSSLFAAPFTAGNLVLYRVGDGAAALGSGGTAVFLDEYTPSGTFVQSVALPTGAGGLVASGTATTEGFLSRSEDGRYLVVPGYSAALGVTVTTSTTVPRVIGRIDGNANIDTSTSYVDASSAGNIRSATSVDGTRFWTSGSTQGPRTIAFGATTATVISTTNTNTRQINVFADQLYLSSGAGTVRMATIGSGTPTTAGQTTTQLPGFPTTTPAAFNSFFLVRLDGGTGPDTLYIAEETSGQIQKWCLNSGTWVQKGSVAVSTARGLTASVSGTTVTLYATSGGTGTPVLTVTDSTGFNGTLAGTATTLIASAGTNKAFRAVAMAPTGGTPVTPPSAPTGLTATAGNAHVALSWTASSGATSYNVKGATVSGGPYSTIATAVTTTSYDDTTAANGTTYFYVVSAVNSGGESASSSEVSATPVAPSTNPSGSGSATPGSVQAGNSTTLTVTVTPGANPASTGITVCADLSSIGGSSTQAFTDNGGNSFSFVAAVSSGTSAGAKSLPVTITDAQSRSGSTSIALTVTAASAPPTGIASTSPGSVLPGATTTITVAVTSGTNPASSGITVTGDLSAIGGSSAQAFADNGGNSFSFVATVASTASVGAKSLPITIADAQGRNSTTSASLTVLPPTTVKISQVYGGGGNSGSTYTNDFLELYNSGPPPAAPRGHAPARPLLPRAGIAGDRRNDAAAHARRQRRHHHERHEREGRARRRHGRAERRLPERPRRPRRLRQQQLLRRRGPARARQHQRGHPPQQRLHRHQQQPQRLLRQRADPAQQRLAGELVRRRRQPALGQRQRRRELPRAGRQHAADRDGDAGLAPAEHEPRRRRQPDEHRRRGRAAALRRRDARRTPPPPANTHPPPT